MVTVNVPDCTSGVPENVPSDVNVRPVGNPLADHVKGGENEPPVAVMVWVG